MAEATMNMPPESDEPRLDKTKFVVAKLDDADDDAAYWWSRSVEERLHYAEFLRRMNYGELATGRLQRVLEVVRRP